jgi:probable HAF family extracellular repeat protein
MQRILCSSLLAGAIACGGSASTPPSNPSGSTLPASPAASPDGGTPPAQNPDGGTSVAPPPTQLASVDPYKELLIVDSTVVLDARATSGVWSFGHTLEQLGGASVARSWLKSFRATSINNRAVDDRPGADDLLAAWPKSADGSLDLAKAPFRLVAVVARLDLLTSPHGEGRLVYGLVDPSTGKPGLMTVAFEYSLPVLGTANDRQAWAAKFHALGAIPFGAEYNAALQSLTDQFANAANLAQVRSNEAAFGSPWELRQWKLTAAGLSPDWTAASPDQSLDGSAQLSQFIVDNHDAVMNGTLALPHPMLAGTSLETGAWRFPNDSRIDEPTRHAFAMQTCNGCHATETFSSQGFFHVNPLKPLNGDGHDRLSHFLLQSELPRRAQHLAGLISGQIDSGMGQPTSLPAMPAGAPRYDVSQVPAPEDSAPVAMVNGKVLGNSASQGPWIYDGTMRFLMPNDSRQPIALGFNSSGEVVGYFKSADRAFVMNTELGTLGGNESQASLVSDSGLVAGQSTVASGTHHAFVSSGSNLSDLGGLGGGETFPFAISPHGLVTGESQLNAEVFTSHAFVWSASGGMTDLGTLGGLYSRGQTIDDSGQVAGFSALVPSDGKIHAFDMQDGQMVDLGSAPGLPWSATTGRNSSGVMVGNLYDVPAPTAQIFTLHAFVSYQGQLLDLNSLSTPPRLLSTAMAIDDAGRILCTDGQVGAETAHAFLLTPR